MKLNNQTIARAKPGDVLKDTTVPGLTLRVFSARKVYYLYYRTRQGVQRRPKLEDHQEGVFGLADARNMAKQWLAEVAGGGDPAHREREDRAAATVSDLWDRFRREKLPGMREKTRKDYTCAFTKYILPKLGRRKITKLGYSDVASLHSGIPYKTMANRALAYLSSALNEAVRWGWMPTGTNPCQEVKRHPERRRRRHLKGEEAPVIARLLKQYEATRPRAVALIWALIFTGARKSELTSARREDLQGNKIVLDRHKTDSAGDARTIHLPDAVLDILKRLPPAKDGTIFGITQPKHCWNRIRQEAGCPDLNIHDLRRSFASAALTAGLTLSQVGELLGHRSYQTTKRYAYLMDEAAQAGAQRTADWLQEMMGA